MKIKRLELSGFKSFVDRSVIHFDEEVMGIVGPNGCGKSNIVDAIRWCMGEQSAKHLRGRSMEDVIFNGSETRPGADLAEVTLTFDNNDPTDVPLEFKDYAEIAVTRRLHRSGESEYLINKTPVRLKDVTDLFLGTGVGTKAYSIVEQGKIGLIVSAKPEDRRLLIEEAAGITKFKSRKKQAEKKMEMTAQNLLRVGDIIAEIDRNLGSLKRQSAKAERYISYKTELEDLQLYEASHRWLELVQWIGLERGEVLRAAGDADSARHQLTVRDTEMETMRLEAHNAEEALERANSANFAAENAVRAEEAAIARAGDRFHALMARETQAGDERTDLATQELALQGEEELLKNEVVVLEREESAFADELSREEALLAELTRAKEGYDRDATACRERIAKAQAEIASAEALLTGFERRVQESEVRLERARNEEESMSGRKVELDARAAELARALTDLESGKRTTAEERAKREEELAHLRHVIVDAERLLEEAKNEHQRKRSRLAALSEVEARLEGVGAGVKALVHAGDSTVQGLVADRLRAPEEFTRALAALVGARLQEVVVRDPEHAVSLLDALAEGKKGRATVIPERPRHVAGGARLVRGPGVVGRLFDRMVVEPGDEGLVFALVGDAVVVESAEVGARVSREDGVAAVTLQGTVFYADGRVSGGTGEDVAFGMLETKREIRALAKDVEALEATVAERLATHQHLRGSIAETQAALEQARQEAHQGELAFVHTEKDLQKTSAECEGLEKRLHQLAGEIEELANALAEASSERTRALETLSIARGLHETESAGLGGIEAEALAAGAEVEAERTVMMEKRVRVAGARERLTAGRGTLARLARSTEELRERAKRLDDELVRGAEEQGAVLAALVKHKEALFSALDAAREAQSALESVRGTFDAYRVQLGEYEGAIKELRGQADAAREAHSRHELALRERELSLSHLVDGVAEKFRGLRLDRVVGDHHLRPPPDRDTHERINELSGLIERMGSINLEAVREHAEAEERYIYYTTQKSDLDRAIADLERAIQQMNRESKKLFQETFEAVNAKFQEVFPRMFRGGRAALRLTDPDDMLETGIDILAQPPGKKLSSIELMSGGEKALTAVSLIFAIFQIKPSPFCILDEVDAPLDEANVARYNETIRSMTHHSQFILITHIKRTMQMVDVLFGVTMQESGVSRLVSVKLNKAEPKRVEIPNAQVA